jgi:hypothetical protein
MDKSSALPGIVTARVVSERRLSHATWQGAEGGLLTESAEQAGALTAAAEMTDVKETATRRRRTMA